jgi:hypothetical protein
MANDIDFNEIDSHKENTLNLVKETDNFIVYYTEFDVRCIDEVLDDLEKNYHRITNNLNQKLDDKLVIEVYSDLKELHFALGLSDAPNWIRGGLYEDKIIIASPLNPPPGSDFDNVLKTAVHEFVHIIVNKINKDIPRWLNEGIACFEAKDNNDDWIRETVKSGLINNKVPTFKDLDTGDDFSTFFNRDGYQYSYTIIESIVEEYGYDKLRSLIKKPNEFNHIFMINEKQLQDKWMDFIKKNYLKVGS